MLFRTCGAERSPRPTGRDTLPMAASGSDPPYYQIAITEEPAFSKRGVVPMVRRGAESSGQT